MAGLITYNRVLASGESQNLSARGKLIVLREAKDIVNVTTIQNQLSGKSGESQSIDMQRHDKYYAPDEFDDVRLTNNTPGDQTIEILVGYGDYVQPPPENPRADIVGGPSVITLDVAGTRLLEFASLRRDVRIKAKESNTDVVILSGSQADVAAAKGLRLSKSEVYEPRARGELWGASPDSAQKVYILEETFVVGPPPPVPAGTTLVMTAGQNGNPCCHCGCSPPGSFGYADGNFFVTIGAIAPDTLFGLHVYQLSQAFNPVQGFTNLILVLPTGTPQNAFTNMELTDTLLGDLNFTSASATFFDPVAGGIDNVAFWQWAAPAQLFADLGTYHAIFT